MELTPEQKQAIGQQKANCVFCQIIAGNIPSKQVYDDDKLIGVLDINPAAKGHTLLMPKEHYPIMPLIPAETFKHTFSKTKAVDGAIKEALLCNETTIFIANGGAAGQQSSHFMLHIIPREKGDGLPFEAEGKMSEEERKEMALKMGPAISSALGSGLASLGYTKQTPTRRLNRQQIINIIGSNPQLKKIILDNPGQFKKLVPSHPQLSQLMAGFDLDDIIQTIKAAEEQAGGAGKGPKKLNFRGKP